MIMDVLIAADDDGNDADADDDADDVDDADDADDVDDADDTDDDDNDADDNANDADAYDLTLSSSGLFDTFLQFRWIALAACP